MPAPASAQPNPDGAYQQALVSFTPPRPQPSPRYGVHGSQPQQPKRNPPKPQLQEPDLTDQRSKKWPKLSAILAADTAPARFRVWGNNPNQKAFISMFHLYRNVSANATPTNQMRLFSKHFPWSIEISTQKDIKCESVWNAIWLSLQEPIEDSEWGMICDSGEAGKARMMEIQKANQKRLELNPDEDRRLLRCDYLCEDAWFWGLEKDEDFLKARPMPHSEHAKQPMLEDSWLIKMGKG